MLASPPPYSRWRLIAYAIENLKKTWFSSCFLCCLRHPHLSQYENLYCVVRGKKIFHLLPPTELYRMHQQQYPAARFEPQVRMLACLPL